MLLQVATMNYNCPLGELEETTRTPSYYMDNPAGPEITE